MEADKYQAVLQQINTGVELTAFGDYIRDLLVDTTLNSIAENQVPELVARAVVTGVWSTEDAIRVVDRIADEQRKVRMCAALLSIENVNEGQRQHLESAARDAIGATTYADTRFHMLLELARSNALNQQAQALILQQALDLALELDAGEARYQSALWALAPELTGSLLKRAVENVSNIKSAQTRAWACAALARQLSADEQTHVLRHGLEAALAISDELHRANALFQLGDQLQGDLLERALQATLAMKTEQWRPRVIEALAGQLNATQQATALAATFTIQHPWYRAFALAGLIPYLSGTLFTQGMEAALSVESDEARALIVSRLTFSPEALPRVLDMVQAMEDEKYRFEALVSLIPQLEGEQRQNALAAASLFLTGKLTDRPSSLHRYPYVMVRLAAQLEGAQQHQLFADTLETVLQIADEEDRADVLVPLIEHLPDDLLPRLVEGVLIFEEDFRRIYVLGLLANRLPTELLKHTLVRAAVANDYPAQGSALRKLSRFLAEPDRAKALQYALRAVQAIQAPWERIEPLIQLLPELDGSQRADALTQALETALILPNREHKVQSLTALLPYLEADQREQILATAREAALAIEDTEAHSRAFVALAAHTEGVQKDELLVAAFEDALGIHYTLESDFSISEQTLRSAAVAHVAVNATGELLTRVLAYFQQTAAPFWPVRMLLDRPLTRQQFETALTLVSRIANSGCRAEGLAVLAKQTDGEEKARLLDQALTLAQAEPNAAQRLRILIPLAEQISGDRQTEVVDLALESVLQLGDKLPIAALLLPFGRNRERLILEIRKAALEDLESHRDKPRQDLLYAFDDQVFAPTMFAPATLATMTGHIIAVCWPDQDFLTTI